MTSLELFARIAAVFGFATLGVAILMTSMAPFKPAGSSARTPILAVELPISTDELTSLIKDREGALRYNTWFDRYLIAAYTAMFMSWALLLPGNRWIAWAALATALATAVFDVLENRAIIAASTAINEAVVYRLQLVGSLKWCAFFLTVLLLASRFWHPAVLSRFTAIAHALLAFVGLAASSAALAVALGRLHPELLGAIRPWIGSAMLTVLLLMLFEALALVIRSSILFRGAGVDATLWGRIVESVSR